MFDKPRSGYYSTCSTDTYAVEKILTKDKEYIAYLNKNDTKFTFPIFYSIFQHLIKLGMRQVYPDFETGLLCQETRNIDNLSWDELIGSQYILPAFIINVPRNLALSSKMGGHCTHLVIDTVPGVLIPAGTEFQIADRVLNTISDLRFMIFWEKRGASVVTSQKTGLDRLTKGDDTEVDKFGFADAQPEGTEIAFILNWCFNVMLLMKAYPTYLETKESKIKLNNIIRNYKETKISLGREHKINKIIINKIQKGEINSSAIKKLIGFREGHWRRQPHGLKYLNENKENKKITFGIFPDGRPYHMVLIAPFIGAKND